MKNKLRVLPAISSIFFWIALTTLSIPVIVLFSLFGVGTGILIWKAKPLSQLTWQNPTLRWIPMLLGTLLAVAGCISVSRFFYQSWLPSALLKGIVTRFIADYKTGLMGISALLGLGMFPFLLDLVCRAVYHAWKMVANIRFASLWKYTAQTITLKSTLKSTGTVLVALLLSASIGIGLLTAVFCIPVDSIDKNVAQSALTIQQEGAYTSISDWFYSRLDNWTDSIILMEAAQASDTTALEAAVNAFHGSVEGTDTPADALVAHYVEGQPYTSLAEYSRYWHGYLVVLKPLLCFMDYSAIRILNGAVQLILVALICLLLRKKGLREYVVPFILMYLMLMPAALACSIQFSTCFYVIVLGSIGMLLIRQEKLSHYAGPLLLAIGIATAYFDFLTYPMATFGIPILMLLLLQSDRPLEEKLFETVKCGIFWCVGFVGMWASKWVISYLVSGYDFANVMSIMSNHTSLEDSSQATDLFRVEALNYTTFLTTPVTLMVLASIGIRYFKSQAAAENQLGVYRMVFPYLLVACAPIVWYAFASGHSGVHYWFTNKACAVTVLGILFAVISATSSKSTQT